MNHEPAPTGTVTELEDLGTDLAGRHKATESSGATVDPAVVDADMAALERDGFVVLEDLISAEDCARIRESAAQLLDRTGRNIFEGQRTQRLYSVLEKTRDCDRLVDHPRVLALLDRLFLPNYLLSQLQVINILPGENAQLLHHDDGFYPLPRPRPPVGAATVWAIDPLSSSPAAICGPTGGPQPPTRSSASRWHQGRACSSSALSGTAAAPTAPHIHDWP
jgi:hypothetical protein